MQLMADLEWEDGSDVVASPRQILRRQLARLAERGWTADGGHRARVHPLQRHLRGGLAQGLPRPRPGQPLQRRLLDARHRAGGAADPPHPQLDEGRRHAGRELEGRVQLRPARDQLPLRATRSPPPTTTSIYKTGAKEIAAQEGKAITFIAKFDEREGNSCHIHCSLARTRTASSVFADDERAVRPLRGRPARLPARADALLRPARQLLQALRGGLVRADRGGLGHDNRTCSLRVVGHGQGLRVENRLPGADVNPYLALAAMIAAGLHGIDNELALEPAVRGQRLRVRQAARAAHDVRRRATCSPSQRWRARRSARRSSTTT